MPYVVEVGERDFCKSDYCVTQFCWGDGPNTLRCPGVNVAVSRSGHYSRLAVAVAARVSWNNIFEKSTWSSLGYSRLLRW